MTIIQRKMLGAGLCGLSLCAVASPGQTLEHRTAQAPAGNTTAPGRSQTRARPELSISVDGRETMFATMCALLASGYESDISADNWSTFRAQMREKLQHQEGPAVDAIREFYKQHQVADPAETLSRYIWFGLVSGPAPRFQPMLRRDELPPEVVALEDFNEVLANYYKEQDIGQLWRQVQPIYSREVERLHGPTSEVVFVTNAYLRQITEPAGERTFTILVEPLVGRITNVRNFGDHYAIVVSGGEQIPLDVIRHAYLHYLLDPLPIRYAHTTAVKRPLYEMAAKAPRLPPDLKDDFASYFAECMVHAVELKLKKMAPGEREAAMTAADAEGLVLVRPLYAALTGYEKSEPSMALYFPDLVRAIDVNAESKRLASVSFAAAERERATDSASEELRRSGRPVLTTVPNDQEAIAALTEGERRIAEKNPKAAEASFRRVLEKYPDQPRAWYGIGLVALLEHDGPRAKQVFSRLTTGEHAAEKDPMVLAWSHIYLARIYEDEGQADIAKTEYQAALKVEGGPDKAQQAAQNGLTGLRGQKTARP
jgi:tetratricopeptide (TPR) repeat protein